MANLNIRVTEAQERHIKKSAEAEGKTISQYCRDVLTNQDTAKPIERETIEEEIAALRAEIIHQNELTRALFKLIMYDEKKAMMFTKELLDGLGAKEEDIAAAEEKATTEANAFLRDLGR